MPPAPPLFFPCHSPLLSPSRRFLSFPYAPPFPFDLILCCAPSYPFLFLALDTSDSPYWTVSLKRFTIGPYCIATSDPFASFTRFGSELLPQLDSPHVFKTAQAPGEAPSLSSLFNLTSLLWPVSCSKRFSFAPQSS